MVQLGPELAPEAGVTMAALAALGALSAYIVARGLVKLGTVLAEAIFYALKWALRHIPFGKRIFNLAIRPVEETIIHLFGRAALALDSAIAHSWHDLARLIRLASREFEGLALDLYHHAHLVAGLWTPARLVWYIRRLLHPVRTAQAILHKLVAIERQAVSVLHHAYADVLLPRVKGAEHAVEGVIYPDLARLRARTKSLEKEYAKLQARLKAKPWLIVGLGYIGALTYALRLMGLSCLTGRNAKRLVPRLCKIPTGLVDFLTGLGFGLFAFSHICDLIELLTPIAQRVLPPLVEVLAKPAAALCGGKHKAAPPLALRTTKLPDVPNPLAID